MSVYHQLRAVVKVTLVSGPGPCLTPDQRRGVRHIHRANVGAFGSYHFASCQTTSAGRTYTNRLYQEGEGSNPRQLKNLLVAVGTNHG